MKRELTCIVCPVGCSLCVNIEKDKIISVTGNNCPRGAVYAKDECTNPVRVLTTTIRCKNGELVSVKTCEPIPKDKVGDAMKVINNTICDLPIAVGDVIIEDVFGSAVVATKNVGGGTQ